VTTSAGGGAEVGSKRGEQFSTLPLPPIIRRFPLAVTKENQLKTNSVSMYEDFRDLANIYFGLGLTLRSVLVIHSGPNTYIGFLW
jgi:hypothetical protein